MRGNVNNFMNMKRKFDVNIIKQSIFVNLNEYSKIHYAHFLNNKQNKAFMFETGVKLETFEGGLLIFCWKICEESDYFDKICLDPPEYTPKFKT